MPASAVTCQPEEIEATGPSALRFAGYQVTLDGPDDPAAPTLWEGPLRAAPGGGGPECRLDIPPLVVKPLGGFADGVLMLLTTSGSNFLVVMVDLRRCALAAQSPRIRGPVRIEAGRALDGAGAVIPGLTCGLSRPH